MSDAFDSDVLIGAARSASSVFRHRLYSAPERIGSVVLLPEVRSKPLRLGEKSELEAIDLLLSDIDLKPVDLEIAQTATTLGAKYSLRAADAIHLATAVVWGAERFHTANSKDFGPHITEIEVVVTIIDDYTEAWNEWEQSGEGALWESPAADGLPHEP